MNGPLSRVPRCTCPISCSAPPRDRDVCISVPVWCVVGCGRGALWDFRYWSIGPWHSILLLVLTNKCCQVVLSCKCQMMGQINPAGFQSPMCMFYVYVIVGIKYFWLDMTMGIRILVIRHLDNESGSWTSCGSNSRNVTTEFTLNRPFVNSPMNHHSVTSQGGWESWSSSDAGKATWFIMAKPMFQACVHHRDHWVPKPCICGFS